MSHYVHFTEEQKTQARQTDLHDLLSRQGEKLKKAGSEYEWLDGTQKVTIRGYLWYHQYEQVGGDAVDFVCRFYNKSYPDAVEFLLGGYGTLSQSPSVTKPPKSCELPKPNDNMRRVYAYLLSKRGIDHEVLNAFVHRKTIYESKPHHNAVFVGYDGNGKAVHAHKRGTGSESNYKGNAEGCDPRYSFHWHGKSNQAYLFEAPIDLLSFISMNKDGWRDHSYAAACGVSDQVLWQLLSDQPQIDTVFLCMDNDDGGQKAVQRITPKLQEKGIHAEILVPTHKDWNEDLLHLTETEEPVCTMTM